MRMSASIGVAGPMAFPCSCVRAIRGERSRTGHRFAVALAFNFRLFSTPQRNARATQIPSGSSGDAPCLPAPSAHKRLGGNERFRPVFPDPQTTTEEGPKRSTNPSTSKPQPEEPPARQPATAGASRSTPCAPSSTWLGLVRPSQDGAKAARESPPRPALLLPGGPHR